MRNWLGCAALLAAFVPVGQANAQSVGHDLENAFKDIIYIWTSPARLDEDALPPIVGIGFTTGALMLVDEPVYGWLSRHPKSLPGVFLGAFGEDSPLNLIGRTFVLVPVSLLLYSGGWAFDKPDLRQAGMGCISANLATTISRNVWNRALARLRPRGGKGAFEMKAFLFNAPWEMRSFPGGHAGHIMSCVSFWSNRFDLGWGEPVLYAAAVGAGWARVMDGAHWPSDTFFGQAYGWSIGKGVADRYLQRSRSGEPVNPSPGVGIMISIPF